MVIIPGLQTQRWILRHSRLEGKVMAPPAGEQRLDSLLEPVLFLPNSLAQAQPSRDPTLAGEPQPSQMGNHYPAYQYTFNFAKPVLLGLENQNLAVFPKAD